jgi:sporulation protein YlmC with PRC-barrel domain
LGENRHPSGGARATNLSGDFQIRENLNANPSLVTRNTDPPDHFDHAAPSLVEAATQTIEPEECEMKKLLAGVALCAALVSGAYAAATMTAAPTESWTVTNYYKQAVYDPKESKIGDIDDVLVDKSGKVTGLVIGVGGFLGAGEKDVIVPFSAIKMSKRNDKWWLTLDETKDDLKNAHGFTYDKASTTWVPDKK